MSEEANEEISYEDINGNSNIIGLSSEEELSDCLDQNSEDDELIKYKKERIAYYKKFYTNKSIYSINFYKKWIYFGSINNKCYIYNKFDEDLKSFANENYSNSCDEKNCQNGKINLKTLKHQQYNDTITNIQFSRSHKYVAISVYNGDIYVYENNNCNGSEILNYNLNNIKKNVNNSNCLLDIYNWNVENEEKTEYINENMKFINILSINSSNSKHDLEYFMFCPFNEQILINIYLNSTSIYIWNVLESDPIQITHTTNIPTFFNICNYSNKYYLIAGFDNSETIVYDYDIYNLKKKNANKNFEKKKIKKGVSFEEYNFNKSELSNDTLKNHEAENVDDVLCIDSSLTNEIYVATHKNIIKIYNINNNNIISTYDNLHTCAIDYCLFNNQKYNLFASSSLDNKVNIYDYQHNKYINQFNVAYDFSKLGKIDDIETGINFLKWINTDLLLFSSLNGNIYIYDIRIRKCIHQFYCHFDTIFNVSLSLHLCAKKNILSVLTASDDTTSNLHFLDISSFI